MSKIPRYADETIKAWRDNKLPRAITGMRSGPNDDLASAYDARGLKLSVTVREMGYSARISIFVFHL